jgi:hypothetical protein
MRQEFVDHDDIPAARNFCNHVYFVGLRQAAFDPNSGTASFGTAMTGGVRWSFLASPERSPLNGFFGLRSLW